MGVPDGREKKLADYFEKNKWEEIGNYSGDRNMWGSSFLDEVIGGVFESPAE